MRSFIARLSVPRFFLFLGLLALALLAALVLWIEEAAERLYWQKWARLKIMRKA